jgi:protein-arginine kinase activator protein McsA
MSGYTLPKRHLSKLVCRQCNDDFMPYRHNQRFCSEACQQRHYYLARTKPRRQRKVTP